MKFYTLTFFLLIYSAQSISFSYDAEDLRGDLEGASDIVLAKKVGGVLSYRLITDEIDSFHIDAIDWRNSDAWKRLQKRNKTKSTFLVLNSIKGDFNIGDEFEFDDSYIPVNLGSVKLYFLYRKKERIESNPCHRIRAESLRREIVALSKDSPSLIEFVLSNRLSFCDEIRIN